MPALNRKAPKKTQGTHAQRAREVWTRWLDEVRLARS